MTSTTSSEIQVTALELIKEMEGMNITMVSKSNPELYEEYLGSISIESDIQDRIRDRQKQDEEPEPVFEALRASLQKVIL